MQRLRRTHSTTGLPPACVIGSMDLVRPLALAGVRSAVVVTPDDVAAHSRFAVTVVPLADPAREPDLLLDRLMGFAAAQPDPPVLIYGQDADVLFVSRRREQLSQGFRFVVADAALVEDLVDKSRFDSLARRLELPVPASSEVSASSILPDEVGLRFPLVVKPVARGRGDWSSVSGSAKALPADSLDDLRALWPRLSDAKLDVILQERIPGPEARVESYHVYVDAAGLIAGEFTGRKIRTDPPAYGETTAAEITAERDVAELGREIVQRIGLRGVAKLDFKRDPSGRLHLLEINPRFNLWHHPGAEAGVNLPALVYRDLLGLPRPLPQPARPGVRWVYHVHDARAARRHGVPMRRWLPWALSCEAKSVVALDDPLPAVTGALMRLGAPLGLGPRAWRR